MGGRAFVPASPFYGEAMPKPEIIYSAQKRGFIKGHRYANPRYFSTPANDVASVIVVGKWQEVIDAYRMHAADVKLTVVDDPRALNVFLERRASGKPDAPQPSGRKQRERTEQAEEITLPAPEEIVSLAFPALRQLASKFSSDEIGSRKTAEQIISTERSRRG